ncbi:hypothetical protein ACFPRL_30315 [Pseudoclavibacter helvolus]
MRRPSSLSVTHSCGWYTREHDWQSAWPGTSGSASTSRAPQFAHSRGRWRVGWRLSSGQRTAGLPNQSCTFSTHDSNAW